MIIIATGAGVRGRGIVKLRSSTTAALGFSLLLAACSRGSEPTNGRENAAAPSAPAATAPALPADASVQARIAEKRRALIADAVAALEDTNRALALIANGKANDALAALTQAIGKLDVVLATAPDLALAPVGVEVSTHDVIATAEAVKEIRDRAAKALDDDRVQEARHLIAGLASEHVIRVTNIPLATYPAALKQAAASIHAGNAARAAAELEAALTTLVVEDIIIPLPLARAEALLDEALPLVENAQRSADQNRRLRALLAAARRQIELAKALGYGSKADLEAISDELNVIEKRTEGQGADSRLLDRIKQLFADSRQQQQQQQASQRD